VASSFGKGTGNYKSTVRNIQMCTFVMIQKSGSESMMNENNIDIG